MRPPIDFGDFGGGSPVGDGASLARTAPFAAARRRLAALTYVLLRSMELAAAAAVVTPDLAFKIALAEHLGRDGAALAALHDRLFGKLPERYRPAASAAVEARFAAIEAAPERGAEVAGLLVAATQALAAAAAAYHADVAPDDDGPTRDLLLGRAPVWAAQRTALAPWAAATAPLPPLLDDAAAADVPYRGDAPLPPLPSWPGRPAHLAYADASIVTHASYADLAADDAKLRRFAHYVYVDVEIAAIEVCAKNLVAFRAMPLAFKCDMARQIWDEARHARVMKALLEELGGHEGEFTYSAKVWRKCEQGRGLAERLAIEQVFQEGNALESNLVFSDAVLAAGRTALAARLDHVNADEAMHARLGNAWLRYLVGDEPAAYAATLARVAATLGVTLSPNVAIDRHARALAGFDDAFVDALAQTGAAVGFRKS